MIWFVPPVDSIQMSENRTPVWILTEALQHRGYALVDVLQPCVTFNRPSSYDFTTRASTS